MKNLTKTLVAFLIGALTALLPAQARPIDRSKDSVDAARIESATAALSDPTGPQNVFGGASEPDHLHPWVVDLPARGCQAVLIHPQWVLTAAHCIGVASSHEAVVTRTDPISGEIRTQSRTPQTASIFKHPEFRLGFEDHDIALIRLPTPFEVTATVQTLALPEGPRNFSRFGVVASIGHGVTLPAGRFAIFRGQLPDGAQNSFTILSAAAGGARLCTGDSGSGIVTIENGRATVRGVASLGGDCPPFRDPSFTDVFAHRTWILQTMNNAPLAINTRVRRTGRGALGQIGLGCINDYGTMWGPTHVDGAELRANCEVGQTQTAICLIDARPLGPLPVQRVIQSFKMRTVFADGAIQETSLPVSPRNASFFGIPPEGATREFTCGIGLEITDAASGGVIVNQ